MRGGYGIYQSEYLATTALHGTTAPPFAIERELATSVFSYLGPHAYKSASAVTVTNAAHVIALFEGHNVIGVSPGHTHVNEAVLWKGIPFITSGAVCGNWWRGSRLGIPEGFTVVELAKGKMTTRCETYGFKSVNPANGPGYKR